MTPVVRALAGALLAACLTAQPGASSAQSPKPPQPAFANGLPTDPGFFPIGVWLQNPRHALAFRAMGINTFVALWKGPNEPQLNQIAAAGMYAIAEHTDTALSLPNSHVIRGWTQIDEPDNAQKLAIGYGDCVMPDEIIKRYEAMRARDPSRPVFLNFGQGLAHKGWSGRGSKCSRLDHDGYYREAAKGGDIVSFDIYPATEARQPAVYGKLELVAEGVRNLKRWVPDRMVWNVIGTTHIYDPDRRPTPAEIRAQVWMSIIAGSRGIVYFLHEWKPSFREDALFRYPDSQREVTRINSEIEQLATVINAGSAAEARVEADVKTASMARQHGGAIYVFVSALEPKPARIRVKLGQHTAPAGAAIGEDRPVLVKDGIIEDEMPAWGVRLYKVALVRRSS